MRKHILVLISLVISSIVGASAEVQIYKYKDAEGYQVYGAMRRISPNGQWAVGGDDFQETGSIIVNTAYPEDAILDDGGLLLDIDNNGMAVGSWYEKIEYSKYQRAAIFKDGEWTLLPLPEQIIGQSAAIAISADSKVIAGHGMCANDAPDEPGKYFPIIWILDENSGEYRLHHLYNNLHLPGAFGFFVYDMTSDGKVVCGLQSLNMGGTIPVMLNLETGEFKCWHNISTREISFQYMGTTYYNDVMTLDGVIEDGTDDGGSNFHGAFMYATDRYLFGSRNVVEQLNQDGTGIVGHFGCVYDIVEDKFYDGESNSFYLSGVSPNEVFNSRGQLMQNGSPATLPSFISSFTQKFGGVYGVDDSGKIWAASYTSAIPVSEQAESPMLIIFDKSPIASLRDIRIDNSNNESLLNIDGRVLSVTGAKNVAIYTLGGALVSTDHSTDLLPGAYIVKADGNCSKIIIR